MFLSFWNVSTEQSSAYLYDSCFIQEWTEQSFVLFSGNKCPFSKTCSSSGNALRCTIFSILVSAYWKSDAKGPLFIANNESSLKHNQYAMIRCSFLYSENLLKMSNFCFFIVINDVAFISDVSVSISFYWGHWPVVSLLSPCHHNSLSFYASTEIPLKSKSAGLSFEETCFYVTPCDKCWSLEILLVTYVFLIPSTQLSNWERQSNHSTGIYVWACDHKLLL